MLVLSRREGESVCLNDNIVVTVVRITGNKIRLGIQTKDPIEILRSELRDKDDQERILEFDVKTDKPENDESVDTSLSQLMVG